MNKEKVADVVAAIVVGGAMVIGAIGLGWLVWFVVTI